MSGPGAEAVDKLPHWSEVPGRFAQHLWSEGHQEGHGNAEHVRPHQHLLHCSWKDWSWASGSGSGWGSSGWQKTEEVKEVTDAKGTAWAEDLAGCDDS